jgi:type I restriction enzyme S subunit
VDPDFVFYFFRSQFGRDELLKYASTVGTPGIGQPLTSLRSIRVPIPPIYEQRAIASLLGALDDKIAFNEGVVSTISDLLTAYFSQVIRQASRRVKLREVVDFRYGKALKEEVRDFGSVPVYGSNGISGWHISSLVDGPGIIIGRKGANAGSVSWSQGQFWPIDTAFYAVPNSGFISFEFLYLLLDNIGLRELVGDSAIPGLNRDIALGQDVVLPSYELVYWFTSVARPLLDIRTQISNESRSVGELRDILLPNLMSGKIRAMDGDKIAEGAT